MKQSEKTMFMEVIHKHQKREAKEIVRLNRIDEQIFKEKDPHKIDLLNESREFTRQEMCRHRDILKELAPIIDCEMKCERILSTSGIKLALPSTLLQW